MVFYHIPNTNCRHSLYPFTEITPPPFSREGVNKVPKSAFEDYKQRIEAMSGEPLMQNRILEKAAEDGDVDVDEYMALCDMVPSWLE